MIHFLLSKKLLFIALSFDLSTSTGMNERNPILGRGTFGIRQASISSGITISELLMERRLHLSERAKERNHMIMTSAHFAAGVSNIIQRER